MKSIIKSLFNKGYEGYDKWSYIKIKERRTQLWLDNIYTFKM
jgi:hypothetical protein